ncbi:MAG: protein-export chaperone SecB [Gammaproteobacteria bacterium]|nr:protein-export chaperone SecB [Gammaproteobacteria bacterium]MCP5139801.1 protein-export chaperone SecB [Chromatiales bacterium]
MAEGPVNGSGSTVDIERTFSLRKLYIKDFSFEAPNSPAFFFEQHQPEMNLNIRTAHSDLGNGSLEVVLHMTAQSVIGERTVFLIEIAQAGMFQISGFNKEETRTIIGVHCPNALYPYAREAISSMVQRGGYPPLVLQPMDFAALFAQASQDTAAAQASQG